MIISQKSLKKFSIVLILSLLLTVIWQYFDPHNSAVAAKPWLRVDGVTIRDENNRRVILRGVSLPDIATNDYRQGKGKSAVELIDMLTDYRQGWYANAIRLPVYPQWKLGYLSNPQRYFNRYIKPAVDKCVEKRVYCIIDWHYIDNPTKVDRQTRQFWRTIAPKFNNYPNILFEVFNENSTDMSWAQWKTIVQPWVDLIRTHAPRNLILVGAPNYSTHLYDIANNPITGSNIVYTAHIYPGLDKKFWDPWIFKQANKIPIFVTEWGFRNGGDYPVSGTISNFGIPLQRKLEQHRLSWICWVADYEWQPEMFDRQWNVLVGENYMGGFVKEYLKKNRSLRNLLSQNHLL